MKKPFAPPIHRNNAPDPAELERLAVDILTYLAADSVRLERFFDLTGLSAMTLRKAAGAPGFIGDLVEYLAADERALIGFAASSGRDPAALAAVRLALARPDRDEL